MFLQKDKKKILIYKSPLLFTIQHDLRGVNELVHNSKSIDPDGIGYNRCLPGNGECVCVCWGWGGVGVGGG